MKQVFLTHIAPSSCSCFAIEGFLPNKMDMDTLFTDETIVEPIVDWQIEPEFKLGCIESMGLKINRVRCRIDYRIADGDDSTVATGEIGFDTDLPEFKDWTIQEVMKFDSLDGSVSPKSISIYFLDKSIEIY